MSTTRTIQRGTLISQNYRCRQKRLVCDCTASECGQWRTSRQRLRRPQSAGLARCSIRPSRCTPPGETSSSASQSASVCRYLLTARGRLRAPVAPSCPTDRIHVLCSAGVPITSIASCAAPTLPTCPSRARPNSNWRSTSRLLRPSGSAFRPRSPPRPSGGSSNGLEPPHEPALPFSHLAGIGFAIAGLGVVGCQSRLVGGPVRPVARVGFLSPESHASAVYSSAQNLDVFRTAMRQYGWIERENLTLEIRYAEGQREALPTLARDLARLPVDVILGSGIPVAKAVRD